jgi:Ca2+-binding EF-hand superfamily protein
MKKFNVNVGAMFQEYDTNNNGRLSAEEIKIAMKKHVQINLGDNEVKLLRDFFVSKYRTPEIKSTHFETLINSQFKRVFE